MNRHMKGTFKALELGVILLIGNALIVGIFAYAWRLYFSLMRGTSIGLNTAFILIVIVTIPICMVALWIKSGRMYRRRNLSRPWLVLNLLIGEIEPVAIGLYLRGSYNSDDLTYLLLAVILNTLFAVAMPLVVALSYLLSKSSRQA